MLNNYLYKMSNDQVKKQLLELDARTQETLKHSYICPKCNANNIDCFIIDRDSRYGNNNTTGKNLMVCYYVKCKCGHDQKSTSLEKIIMDGHRAAGTFTQDTKE